MRPTDPDPAHPAPGPLTKSALTDDDDISIDIEMTGPARAEADLPGSPGLVTRYPLVPFRDAYPVPPPGPANAPGASGSHPASQDAAQTQPSAPIDSPAREPSSGHRGGAEHTGRTGIFFAPSHLTDGDLDELPAFEPSPTQGSGWHYVTGQAPNRLRRFIVTRLSPVLGLSAVILWSYLQLTGGRTPRPQEPGTPSATKDADVPPPPPTDEKVEEPEEDEEPELAPPDLKLATADVIEILEDGRSVPRRMNRILARDRVTVLNLWATFCAPCKAELPAFRQLFEEQEHIWSDEVDFIPVQINDPIDGATARRDHAATMPAFKHFLSDRGLSTGIQAALRADGRAPAPWALPVTVVVDCNGKIEDIFARSFRTLDDLRPVFDAVGRARGKLPACRARRVKNPATLESSEAPHNTLLSAPLCGAIACQRDEVCTKQPPALKPACVTARGSVTWSAP